MKKILLSLLGIITLGLVNFGYCAFSEDDIPSSAIIYSGSVDFTYSGSVNSRSMYLFPTLNYPYTQDIPYSYYCAYFYNIDSGSLGDNAWLTFGFGSNRTEGKYSSKSYSYYPDTSYFVEPSRSWLDRDGLDVDGVLLCAYSSRRFVNLGVSEQTVVGRTYKFDYIIFDYNKLSFGSSVDCSEDSNYLQCLEDKNTCEGLYNRLETNYELLEGNYNTCTSELSSCLENGGSSSSGDIQWSSLYINQVQHLGNKNIYIDIPLDYEYSYTNEGDYFQLTVEGLNQDQEYLSGVINKQNYIPTSEDFSNVFSNLGLFGSLLVVCLFVILVFYMIKKIFD